MTLETYRNSSGYMDDPIEGTKYCFLHGDWIYCLLGDEVGKAVDYAVNTLKAESIRVDYHKEDDLWSIRMEEGSKCMIY